MMKIIKCLLASGFIVIFGTGCQSIKCNGQKTKNGNITVIASKNGNTFSTVTNLGGQLVSSQLGVPRGIGSAAGKAAAHIPLSDAEKQNIIDEAKAAAEDYVKKNSKKFCDKCGDGACQATAETHSVNLVGEPEVSDGSTRDRWTVKFEFEFSATVSCGPCIECDDAVAVIATGNQPMSCTAVEGEPTITLPTGETYTIAELESSFAE